MANDDDGLPVIRITNPNIDTGPAWHRGFYPVGGLRTVLSFPMGGIGDQTPIPPTSTIPPRSDVPPENKLGTSGAPPKDERPLENKLGTGGTPPIASAPDRSRTGAGAFKVEEVAPRSEPAPTVAATPLPLPPIVAGTAPVAPIPTSPPVVTDSSGKKVPSPALAIIEGLATWRSMPGTYAKYLASNPDPVLALATNESSLRWNVANDEGGGMKSWGPIQILDKYARDLYGKRSKIGSMASTLAAPPTAPDVGNPKWGPVLTTYPSAVGYLMSKIMLWTDFMFKHFTWDGTSLKPKAKTTDADLRKKEEAIAALANTKGNGAPAGTPLAVVLQLWNKGSSFEYVAKTAANAEGIRIADKSVRAMKAGTAGYAKS